MKKRLCAILLVMAMILCQMPPAAVQARASESDAQIVAEEAVTEETAEEAQAETEIVREETEPEEMTAEAEDISGTGEAVLEEAAAEMEEPDGGDMTGEAAQTEEDDEPAQTDETAQISAAEEEPEKADEPSQAAPDVSTEEVAQIIEAAPEEEPADDAVTEAIIETEEIEEITSQESKDAAIAAPTNLRWEDKTGKWDAVDGAQKYKVELFRVYDDGTVESVGTATPTECEYTFWKIVESEPTTYYFTVKAVSGENQSEASKSENAQFDQVPAPGNPRWDGKIARWDAVDGYDAYYLQLRRSAGTEEDNYVVIYGELTQDGVCEVDLTEAIDEGGDGRYYFSVRVRDVNDKYNTNYYGIFATSNSPVETYGDPDRIMLPRPDASDLVFSMGSSAHLVANWAAPSDLDSDVKYISRVTLYKDDVASKRVDVEMGTFRYDFTASGDVTAEEEAEVSIGVRYIPAEGETRYCAGLEQTMYSWNAITPATDLPRTLTATIDTVRAGATKLTFWPTWTGGYGGVSYILLRLSVERADGTTETPVWCRFSTRGKVTGSGTGSTYSTDSDLFQVGDVVTWEATLTNNSNHDTDSVSGISYATCSGSFVVEAATPHTVTLKGNGLGSDSSLVVEDNEYLPRTEGYLDALPVAEGYAVSGFSTLKKGLGEYTSSDYYTDPITQDMTLYAIWAKAVDTVELNVDVPVCGTVVEMDDSYNQINGPVVESPMDALYMVDTWYGLNWYTKGDDGSKETFNGTIKAGEMYYFTVTLEAGGRSSYGGAFTKDVKLTGNYKSAEILYITPQFEYTTFIGVEIGMMAEHDWGEWEIVKEATETEDGLRRRTCRNCGEKEEEIIRRTGASTITVTTDGNGTASADAEAGAYGEEITLTATPADGYRFYQWEVISGDISIDGDTFTMGSENVEVKAIFGKIPGKSKKVTVYNVAQGIKVTWLKVDDATSYYIYRDDLDGKGYKFLFRTSALQVTDLEVRYELGKKFRYKVLATSKYGGDAEGFRTATYYRLMPTGITSVKNTGAGKMTVTYDKSRGSSGYVVRYGLKKDMSDAKVITVKGENTTSRTFNNLKKGKTYYVQARTYKIEDGIRYYSGYCTTKTVKIVK